MPAYNENLSCLRNPMNLSILSTRPHAYFYSQPVSSINKNKDFQDLKAPPDISRKSFTLGNPLFISVWSSPIYPPLTSIQPSPRDSRG